MPGWRLAPPKGALALLLPALLLPATEASAWSGLPVPGNSQLSVSVRSVAEMRFEKVVRQEKDLSCGAAALATLLRYYHREEIGEEVIIEHSLRYGDAEQILKHGFSMLELKRFADMAGYQTGGFQVKDPTPKSREEFLRGIRVPVLTLTNVRGYMHFVVLKGVDVDGSVRLADPAFGNRTRPMSDFLKEWQDVVLVVLREGRPGVDAFSKHSDPTASKDSVFQLIDFNRGALVPTNGEFR